MLIFPAKPLSGPGSESENLGIKFAVYLLQSPLFWYERHQHGRYYGMSLLCPASSSAPSNLKPPAVYKKMLQKQFQAILCLAPTIDQSSNYQSGMDRETAERMAASIVEENIVRLASDSDEEIALMLKEAIEQIKQGAKQAREDAKSTPNVPNTRNSVKIQEHMVTCLAFFVVLVTRPVA